MIVVQSLAEPFLSAFKRKILKSFPTEEVRLENETSRKFGKKHPGMSHLRLHRFRVVIGYTSLEFDVRECPDGTDLTADLKTRDFTVNCLYLNFTLYNNKSCLRIISSQRVSGFNTNLILTDR